MRRLKPEELRAVCDPVALPFRSTEELPSLEGMIGQRRALDATTFGIGMRHHGYNMFVLGEPATGKTRMMRRVLAAAAGRFPEGTVNAAVEETLIRNVERVRQLREPVR